MKIVSSALSDIRVLALLSIAILTAGRPAQAIYGSEKIAERLARDGRFNTLLAAANAAGLAETLSTGDAFTVFAPTDEAFAKLPAGTVKSLLANPEALRNVLLYHVVGDTKRTGELLYERSVSTLQGEDVTVSLRHGRVFVNDSRVINANVRAANGVIHVIDTVLLPPAPKPNLLATLEADGRFGTLIAALTAAGLDGVVATGGPFTIFAPTDEAFARLPEGTVEALLANVEGLKALLLYHVVSGDKSDRELLRERSVETLEGQDVRVRWIRGRVYVNGSRVISANVDAANGTIHAIDEVLLPSAENDCGSRGDDDE